MNPSRAQRYLPYNCFFCHAEIERTFGRSGIGGFGSSGRDEHYPKDLDLPNTRIRKENLKGTMPVASIRSVVSAVGCFERWFWAQNTHDNRQIFEIPPEELDGHLANYFTVFRNTSNLCTPSSLLSMRSRLARYLKEKSYPVSILNTTKFRASQKAFKERMAHLKEMPDSSSFL